MTNDFNATPIAVFRVVKGDTTVHLSHPTNDVLPNGNVVRHMPAKVQITDKGTVITEEMTLGTGKGALSGQAIVDAIRGTRAFERGTVLDITDNDPLNVKQQERRRRDQELAELQDLRDDKAALEAQLELAKAESGNDPAAVKALKKKIKDLEKKEYRCPFCRTWTPVKTAPAFQKKAGLASHMNGCKKRPSSDEDVAAATAKADSAMPQLPDGESDPRLKGDKDPDMEALTTG